MRRASFEGFEEIDQFLAVSFTHRVIQCLLVIVAIVPGLAVLAVDPCVGDLAWLALCERVTASLEPIDLGAAHDLFKDAAALSGELVEVFRVILAVAAFSSHGYQRELSGRVVMAIMAAIPAAWAFGLVQ